MAHDMLTENWQNSMLTETTSPSRLAEGISSNKLAKSLFQEPIVVLNLSIEKADLLTES